MDRLAMCVKGEIHNVVSLLRQNRKWGSKARFQNEIPLQSESPILRSFKVLHRYMQRSADEQKRVDTMRYLRPFLDVIMSEWTSGPVTGVALASVNKFLLYGFVTRETPHGAIAINEIAHAVSVCRFEATEAHVDEVVVLQMMELMVHCLRCDAGVLLSDELVWDMLQACFRISRESKATELLSHTAENTVAHMVLTIFGRDLREMGTSAAAALAAKEIATLKEEGAPAAAASPSSSASAASQGPASPAAAPRPAVSPAIAAVAAADDAAGRVTAPPSPDIVSRKSVADSPAGGGGGGGSASRSRSRSPPSRGATSPARLRDNEAPEPYGIPVLLETLRFLAALTDPATNDEDTRVLGLGLMNIVLEAGGEELSELPPLVEVMQDDLCKYLLQNMQGTCSDGTTDELPILSLTLRVVYNIFSSIKAHLKVQLEVFFTSVHLRIADSAIASPEQKELVLESLLDFCFEPSLMVDLYVNYDCDVQCTNLFENLFKCLCRNAEPGFTEDGGAGIALNTLHLHALEGIMVALRSTATRCDAARKSGSSGAATPRTDGIDVKELQREKEKKKRLQAAVATFNAEDPERMSKGRWCQHAAKLQLITAEDDAVSIAQFLRTAPGLDKMRIGEYLGAGPPEKYPLCKAVLEAFVATFDFNGMLFDNGLRLYLDSFRLPGESQKIERLMEKLASRLYEGLTEPLNPPFESADVVFILSYSVIMLNTDLHNETVEQKMTKKQFRRNLQGTNGGEDLPVAFLDALYDRIEKNEIRLNTRPGQPTSSVEDATRLWEGVMKRTASIGRTRSMSVLAGDGGSSTESPITIGGFTHLSSPILGPHEFDMFSCIAEPAATALLIAFERTTLDSVVRRVSEALYHFAKCAFHFKMSAPLNRIIIALCNYFLAHSARLDLLEVRHMRSHIETLPEECDALVVPQSRALRAIALVFEILTLGSREKSAKKSSSGGAGGMVAVAAAAAAASAAVPLPTSEVKENGIMTLVDEGWRNIAQSIVRLQVLDLLPVELTSCRDPSHVTKRRASSSSMGRGGIEDESGGGAQSSRRESGGNGGGGWFSWFFEPSDSGAVAEVDAELLQMLRGAVNRLHVSEVFSKGTREMGDVPFLKLAQTLAVMGAGAGAGAKNGGGGAAGSRSPDALNLIEQRAVVTLSLLRAMVMSNSHRLEALWSILAPLLKALFALSNSMRLRNIAIQAMHFVIRLSNDLLYTPDHSTLFVSAMELLLTVPSESGDVTVTDDITLGASNLLMSRAKHMQSERVWRAVIAVLRQNCHSERSRVRGGGAATYSFSLSLSLSCIPRLPLSPFAPLPSHVHLLY